MNPGERAAVVVIGAGPAGVGVAVGLARRGVGRVVVAERRQSVGGVPALYRKESGDVPTFLLWTRGRVLFGEQLAERLAGKLPAAGVEVWLESQVIEIFPREKRISLVSPMRGKLDLLAEAVVLASGARERTPAERAYITGSRPGRVLFTKNLLELAAKSTLPSAESPVILGSDLIAYALSAKLKAAAAAEAAIVDRSRGPQCSLPARIYFRRWAKPSYYHAHEVRVAGRRSVSAIGLPDGRQLRCDRLLISGELTPSSELALMAGLRVELRSRRPVVNSSYQLSEPGWFAAGNILGGNHGAEWCYRNGLRVAACVARYLRSVRAAR